jgi:hypothetical protein
LTSPRRAKRLENTNTNVRPKGRSRSVEITIRPESGKPRYRGSRKSHYRKVRGNYSMQLFDHARKIFVLNSFAARELVRGFFPVDTKSSCSRHLSTNAAKYVYTFHLPSPSVSFSLVNNISPIKYDRFPENPALTLLGLL